MVDRATIHQAQDLEVRIIIRHVIHTQTEQIGQAVINILIVLEVDDQMAQAIQVAARLVELKMVQQALVVVKMLERFLMQT